MAKKKEQLKKAKTCFTFHEEGRQVIAIYMPDAEAEKAKANDIKKMIVNAGFADLHIKDDALHKLEGLQYSASEAVEVAVAERLNGEVSFDIARDGMQARMSITRPQGGLPVDIDDVRKGLAESGIVYGIKDEVIQQAIEAGSAKSLIVAEGSLPEHGEDSRFVALYKESVEDHPKLDASGRADMRELDHFLVVKKGDPLMRRHPPTPGIAGHTVRGEELPPTPGREQPFATKMSGAEVDSVNHDLLVAVTGGQPQMIERGVIVNPVLLVPTVDIKTGNIHFEGTVKISGDVVAGTTVTAKDDIVVSGTVEGASLIAGKNITVGQGIIGRGENRGPDGVVAERTTRIVCGGNLMARFIENSYVEVENDVLVTNLIMHSEVQAGNQLIVGDERTKRGHVLGGILRAGRLIQAKVLGSPAEIHTELEVGVAPTLHHETEETHQKLSEKMVEKNKLIHLVEHLETLKEPEKQALLGRARERLTLVHEELKTLSRLYLEMQGSEQCNLDARIVVQSRVFHGVQITICGVPYSIGQELAGGVFTLHDKDVEYAA